MKQTIKEEIIRNREIMGLNSKSIIKESKDDKINLSLAAAFATIMAVDEEFGDDLYDCVKNNAKIHNVILNHNVIMPTASGGVIPANKVKGISK